MVEKEEIVAKNRVRVVPELIQVAEWEEAWVI